MGGILTSSAGFFLDPETDLNQSKDLTSQIDGVTDTFDVGENFSNLRVYVNGMFSNSEILTTLGTTFQLCYVPPQKPGRALIVIFDKPC